MLNSVSRYKKWLAIAGLFSIMLIVGIMMSLDSASKKQKAIKIAIPGPWNTLHPGLQHTLFADLILSNQIEALVGMDEKGLIVPLAAKSWTFTDDFKTFTFAIDRSKTFSDGTPLTARSFKDSWENSLRLTAYSTNNSLLDVLYKLEGFDTFEQMGHISGIEVVDEGTLRLHFRTSFRMALDHLHGNRFAAFKEKDGKYLGTGMYEIQEVDETHLRFIPRPEHSHLTPVDVEVLPDKQALEALKVGSIDGIMYIMGASISPDLFADKNIQYAMTSDALHQVLSMNNLPGRFFSKREHRLALQYLIAKALESQPDYFGSRDFFSADPQIFLEFQAGRLSADEVRALTAHGQQYVEDFIAATQKQPLHVVYREIGKHIVPYLKSLKIGVSEKSQLVSAQESLKMYYKTFEPDLFVNAFSVANGDPDGIYHNLGPNGAITTPLIQNTQVGELLEAGRSITDRSKMDAHYRSVSKAFLQNAPVVHLGFSKALMVFRKDRLAVDQEIAIRNHGHVHIFRPVAP